ncbi:MAG: TolC family protein [Kiritimatiellae bacterium]|nr:TolC family protein [Kiritimatiellia bacterium]
MKRMFCLAVAAGVAAGAWGEQVREVTLGECIGEALRNNLELQIQRVAREEASLEEASARGGYDPELTASATRRHEETSGESAGTAEGALATAKTKSDADSYRVGIGGKTGWTGLEYEASAHQGRSDGERGGNPFDTSTAGVGVTLTQPLLRGFKTDETRWRVATAGVASREAVAALEGAAQDLLGEVETAWYRFVQAREEVGVQEEALRLAERLLEDNRRKVQIGAMAALDEKQAESQAASARAALSEARQAAREAENALKRIVFADARGMAGVRLEPGEALPEAAEARIDVGAEMERALERRPDLREARLALEKQGLAVELKRNQRLPALDLVVGGGLEASDEENAGDAWGTVGDADEPYWTAGVTLRVPLGNRSARAEWRKSQAAARRLELRLRQLEEAALAGVDNAASAAESGFERVAASREAREYAERALETEQRKLDSGKSTSFVVLQLQKDLTAARQAEIAALADYHRRMAELSLATGGMFERHGVVWE